MKVGLLFGTFDPIHNGHLTIVENAISTNLLDQVWFVVTPQSPFKKNSIIASRHHRFKMVELATQSFSNFFASKIEFQLEYPNYTFNTLSFLNSQFGKKHEFSIIVGLDNYISLIKGEWYKSEYLLKNYRFFIYQRSTTKFLNDEICFVQFAQKNRHIILDGLDVEISSSQIRELFSCKNNLFQSLKNEITNHSKIVQKLHHLLPQIVIQYIENNDLYLGLK